MRNYIFILTLIVLFGCSTPKQLNDYYSEDKNINLYTFVGKKISVTEFDPNAEEKGETIVDKVTGENQVRKSHIMDLGFRCKYSVLKNVFNKLENDTIDFVAYDHYGNPRFSEYKTVLLYISKSTKGNYYFHQKYQFDYLEKTSDGKFYGYTYDRKEKRKRITFKNKKIASIEDLFVKKKEEVFKSLFKKNGN
ncbi:hypothetical protein [Flavobacterium sp.]|uniref:hypothetical protein n=1 Tax=Flavobacterium sp. TaxID=239 RepID=UPI0026039C52|nr:hypothetical protein [Flavobacterium sp.]